MGGGRHGLHLLLDPRRCPGIVRGGVAADGKGLGKQLHGGERWSKGRALKESSHTHVPLGQDFRRHPSVVMQEDPEQNSGLWHVTQICVC